MSTFDGFVSEFPQIRIDYFRNLPGKPQPLACFLSHVHSDHLVGLDSLRSPFVYCSAATRSLVLKLEKYPHRMNFAKGILECRKQTYKHLRTLLKSIPLETPTKIELSPGNHIQVTLFDANHCLGAVSFLVEGRGKAILYTGDVRAEPWWVNSLTRQPKMVPYACGIRKLDMLYLDTTFADKGAPYQQFPSKSEGIAEMLRRVKSYRAGTVFYFHAWTFGYEDAWLALSQALDSRIHLDRYRYEIYTSIAKDEVSPSNSREAAWLCGYKFGNSTQPGILTRQVDDVRIHSCEKGTECHVFAEGADVVDIVPIISRHDGVDMEELGAGGGKGDLDQIHELEIPDEDAITQLTVLSASKLQDPATTKKVESLLTSVLEARHDRLPLNLPNDWTSSEDEAITLPQAIELLAKLASKDKSSSTYVQTKSRPNLIQFPYSRHSSYSELRGLVHALQPKDVFPCTAPSMRTWVEATMSMHSLFGDLLPPDTVFSWDEAMRAAQNSARPERAGGFVSRESQSDASDSQDYAVLEHDVENQDLTKTSLVPSRSLSPAQPQTQLKSQKQPQQTEPQKQQQPREAEPQTNPETPIQTQTSKQKQQKNQSSNQSNSPLPPNNLKRRMQVRQDAFNAADQGRWHEIELISTRRRRHRYVEIEEEL